MTPHTFCTSSEVHAVLAAILEQSDDAVVRAHPDGVIAG